MILVTGGAGFIGQRLIRRLVDEGREVRTLIRPSVRTPQLPHGVAVEAGSGPGATLPGIGGGRAR